MKSRRGARHQRSDEFSGTGRDRFTGGVPVRSAVRDPHRRAGAFARSPRTSAASARRFEPTELSASDKIAAGRIYLLRRRDQNLGRPAARRGGIDIATSEAGRCERAVTYLRDLGSSRAHLKGAEPIAREMGAVLSPASAGSYVDRKFAELYGDEAVDVLESLLRRSSPLAWEAVRGK